MIRAPKGLEGVIVATTSLTKIDGQAGRLIYRGYDVTQLAGRVSYESVAHLLWYGHLPNRQELSTLETRFSREHVLPNQVIGFLKGESKVADPLSALQTSVSILGGLGSRNEPSLIDSSIGLTARMPTIVATYHRLRKGQEPVTPRPGLGHAANYLYMLNAKPGRPEHVHALDSYFTLLADHSLNASTFVARIAASTLTDVHSAVVAAISALKGPLHGGAPIYVWEMLQSIRTPENAESWLRDRLQKHDRIMGFGHRVYRTEDPRSRVLKELARQIVDPSLFELATTVEDTARRLLREQHPERPIDVNVEFYSSVVLHAVGIPPELFTCTFACARTVGWTAHIVEQLQDNRLFRPDAEYVGP
ncbi:MAG: citrate synthase/methylcitrate synthase, partial [Ktedonobacter sp. 13_1_20CM_4_53_7]